MNKLLKMKNEIYEEQFHDIVKQSEEEYFYRSDIADEICQSRGL